MAKKQVAKKTRRKKAPARSKTSKKTSTRMSPKKTARKPAVARRSKTPGTVRKPALRQDAAIGPDAAKPVPKTHLTIEALEEFRRILLAKRAELVGDVDHLTKQALNNSGPGGPGSLSNVPIHMADVGSDNWEQDFTLGLIETERQVLKEIDVALERINQKTYGVCEATHKPISRQRLYAKPWARYCIEYARQIESGRIP